MLSKNFKQFKNIDNSQYNCGGFALGLVEWVTPYINCDNCPHKDNDNIKTDDWDNLCENCLISRYARNDFIENCINTYDLPKALELIVKSDVEALINKYDFLKVVNISNYDDYDNRKLIAYRIGIENNPEDIEIHEDFHFRVRINKTWYEKCGSGAIKKINTSDIDIENDWCAEDFVYNSPIVYFIDCRDN